MKWFNFGFSPLYDEFSDGAGGGGVEVNPGGADGSEAPAEPTVIDIPSEDALIRVAGSDKPVKYGDHFRTFQAQATKANQARAQIEREYIREKTLREQYERERQMAQQTRQNGQQPDPRADLINRLEQLPYLEGKEAAQVVRGIYESIGQEMGRRDQILVAALQEIGRQRQILGSLQDTHVNSTFEAKINGYLEQGGHPKEFANIAKELYLAYEPGPDLDEEFPQILANRIAEVQRGLEAQRQAAIERNRSRFVPGRGGNAGPHRPVQFKGNESAADMAAQLWDSLQGSGT